MGKSKANERRESRGSIRNREEENVTDGERYGEEGEVDDEGDIGEEDDAGNMDEEGDIDEDGDIQDEGIDGEDEGDYEGESNANLDGTDEEDKSFEEEDDDREVRGQRESKPDSVDAKKLLRKFNGSSNDSGSSGTRSGTSGSRSKSSFEDSLDNSKSMKKLKSSIRDHELPLRIAYEQLDELAANAEKVKSAIEKNRSILNVQVKKSNSRYLRAAFAAWKLDLDWQKTKKRDVLRADTWRRKSLMTRAFRAWIRDHTSHGKVRRLEKSVLFITQRHMLRRCWYISLPLYFKWFGKVGKFLLRSHAWRKFASAQSGYTDEHLSVALVM